MYFSPHVPVLHLLSSLQLSFQSMQLLRSLLHFPPDDDMLQESWVFTGQLMILEVMNANGTWPGETYFSQRKWWVAFLCILHLALPLSTAVRSMHTEPLRTLRASSFFCCPCFVSHRAPLAPMTPVCPLLAAALITPEVAVHMHDLYRGWSSMHAWKYALMPIHTKHHFSII